LPLLSNCCRPHAECLLLHSPRASSPADFSTWITLIAGQVFHRLLFYSPDSYPPHTVYVRQWLVHRCLFLSISASRQTVMPRVWPFVALLSLKSLPPPGHSFQIDSATSIVVRGFYYSRPVSFRALFPCFPELLSFYDFLKQLITLKQSLHV